MVKYYNELPRPPRAKQSTHWAAQGFIFVYVYSYLCLYIYIYIQCAACNPATVPFCWLHFLIFFYIFGSFLQWEFLDFWEAKVVIFGNFGSPGALFGGWGPISTIFGFVVILGAFRDEKVVPF